MQLKFDLLQSFAFFAAFARGLILQLIFPLGVEKLVGAVVIGFGNENFCGTVQVAVLGKARVHKFLRGDDAVFFEHHDEHLCIDDGAGVEKFQLKEDS